MTGREGRSRGQEKEQRTGREGRSRVEGRSRGQEERAGAENSGTVEEEE